MAVVKPVHLTLACGWLNMSGSSSEAIRQKRLHFMLLRCMLGNVVLAAAAEAEVWRRPILRSSRCWTVRSGQLGRAREGAGRLAFPSVSDPTGTVPRRETESKRDAGGGRRERERESGGERLCVCRLSVELSRLG